MSEPFATGRCLCGAVSYTIHGEPVRTAQCHCVDCQRASGSGHMSIAFFKADDVKMTGETKSYPVTADSGNVNTRHFCPGCGSRVYGENSARPGIIGLPVGCMDNKDWFAPQAILYTKHKAGWDYASQDVPNFDGMPIAPK